jgi:hypothetical protein
MKQVKWLWVLVGIVVAGFVIGGYGLYENHQKQVQQAQEKKDAKLAAQADIKDTAASFTDSDMLKLPSLSNVDVVVYLQKDTQDRTYVVHTTWAAAASGAVGETQVKKYDSYSTYSAKTKTLNSTRDTDQSIRENKDGFIGKKVFESLNYKVERTN